MWSGAYAQASIGAVCAWGLACFASLDTHCLQRVWQIIRNTPAGQQRRYPAVLTFS